MRNLHLRGAATSIDLDRFEDAAVRACTHFSSLAVKFDQVEEESTYYAEAWFDDVHVATSQPVFLLPGSHDLDFIFDPPVPFYGRVLTLKYHRSDEDGVRYDLQVL